MKKLPISDEIPRFIAGILPTVFFVGIAIFAFKPTEKSAIQILDSAVFYKVFNVIAISLFMFLFLSVTINYLCLLAGFKEKNAETISIYLTAIITLFITGRNLLIVLTNEQFSLLATFISLPFVTIIPRFMFIIQRMKNEQRQIKQNERLNDDTKID